MINAAKEFYPYIPVNLLLKDRYENYKKIKNIKIPILVMHGEKDTIVPFSMGKKIYQLANEPKYSYFTKQDDHMMVYDDKYFLEEYDFPVFPDDFAYYLLKDNKTLVMISAVKSLNANFKFDISKKKLELYPNNGKFEFIISSIAKNCGHDNFNEIFKCSFYKPLISSTLIN
jgi:homoserine acetyltransferase